jgi:hypothetical protein
LSALAVFAAAPAAAHHDGDDAARQVVNFPVQALKGGAVRPDLPVGSIVVRRAFPDHPVGRGQGAEHSTAGCDKHVDMTSQVGGVAGLAAQDNGICTSADIDTYVQDGTTYVVQAGGEQAAVTITDVSDPANPVGIVQLVWTGIAGASTYTPDVKAFTKDGRYYVTMGLERISILGWCGVDILDVTDPLNVVEVAFMSGASWCDVHNVFVEDDVNGEGAFIYATADNTYDLRVLDISGAYGGSVTSPVEISKYTSPTVTRNPASGAPTDYVHDVTVVDHGGTVGRRVYLSYWDSGLVVLDADDLARFDGGPVVSDPPPVIGPDVLDPAGFQNHHAFPSADGNHVFIQDEFLNAPGDEPVQMWDISNPSAPVKVDGIALGTDIDVNPAHNLEIRYDINPNRLYVGWYKLGLQAFDFDATGFLDDGSGGLAGQWHQAQVDASDDAYDGAWGVRLAELGGNLYVFQSDRRYGLIVDCAGAGGDLTGCGSTPPPNQSPTADAGPDQTVVDSDGLAGETVTLDGSGSSDPDGSIVSYAWTWAGGSASGVSPSVDLPDGSTTVTLTVTDNQGATGVDTVVVTVNAPPVNQPPTADAGPDQTVVLDGTAVALSGSGSFDGDGSIASYAWTFVKVPRKSALTDADLTGAATVTASFVPDKSGDYTVQLTVTDNGGLSASDTVVVTVQKPPKSGGGGKDGGGGGKPTCNRKNPCES